MATDWPRFAFSRYVVYQGKYIACKENLRPRTILKDSSELLWLAWKEQ